MRDSLQLEVSYLMLVLGKHLRLTVQDVAAIPERFEQTVYHGTSLGALCGIMGTGFRPSLGAGSDEAGKQYNCSLPMFTQAPCWRRLLVMLATNGLGNVLVRGLR